MHYSAGMQDYYTGAMGQCLCACLAYTDVVDVR